MGTKGENFTGILFVIYYSLPDGDIFQLHLWSFILDKEVITQVLPTQLSISNTLLSPLSGGDAQQHT